MLCSVSRRDRCPAQVNLSCDHSGHVTVLTPAIPVTSVHSSLHGYFWHMNINPADDSLEPFKKVFFNQFWLWVIAVVWVLIWPGIRNVHNLILSPAKFYSDNICMDLNDSQMYLIVISICHCMDLQWNTKAITMINCSGDQFNHFLWSFYFPYLTSLSLT